MDNLLSEGSSTSYSSELKFQHTFTVANYQKIIPILKNGGEIESKAFSIDPAKEITFKVIWNEDTNKKAFQFVPPSKPEGPFVFSAPSVPGTTVSKSIASIICLSVPPAGYSVWLMESECAIKKSDCNAKCFEGKFPTVKPLRQGSKLSCNMGDVNKSVSESPYIHLHNGDLIIVVSLTVAVLGGNALESANGSLFSVPRIIQNYENLFEKSKFTDVDFLCGGKNFSAHKGILWARSETFAQMFDMQEKPESLNTNVIEIDDLSADVFQEGLHFIYTGMSPTNMKEISPGLLTFAEKFGVADLKKICENEMVENISIENVCNLFLVAVKHNASKLRAACFNFIKNNSKAVIATSSWKTLKTSHIGVASEILEAMIRE